MCPDDPDDLEFGEIRYRSDVIGADLLAQIQPVEGAQDDPWEIVSHIKHGEGWGGDDGRQVCSCVL